MTTIAELERRLLHGLDAETQDTRHDDTYIALLREYERQVDRERQTCLRPARRRVVGQGRLEGVR